MELVSLLVLGRRVGSPSPMGQPWPSILRDRPATKSFASGAPPRSVSTPRKPKSVLGLVSPLRLSRPNPGEPDIHPRTSSRFNQDGKHPGCDQSYFGRREFSFTLESDIYLRFQSFNTVSELERETCLLKTDIGPVYSVDILVDLPRVKSNINAARLAEPFVKAKVESTVSWWCVLDAVTASIDTATDNVIQETILEETNRCMVITMAHRILIVIDSDDGKIVEYESPTRLLEDSSLSFSKLVAKFLRRSSLRSILRVVLL